MVYYTLSVGLKGAINAPNATTVAKPGYSRQVMYIGTARAQETGVATSGTDLTVFDGYLPTLNAVKPAITAQVEWKWDGEVTPGVWGGHIILQLNFTNPDANQFVRWFLHRYPTEYVQLNVTICTNLPSLLLGGVDAITAPWDRVVATSADIFTDNGFATVTQTLFYGINAAAPDPIQIRVVFTCQPPAGKKTFNTTYTAVVSMVALTATARAILSRLG